MSPEGRQALIAVARTQNESITGIEDAVTEVIDKLDDIQKRSSSQSGEIRSLGAQVVNLAAEIERHRKEQQSGFAMLERHISRLTPMPPRG